MIIFLCTLTIFLMVIGILMWVKHPHYRMQKQDVEKLFQQMLVGQASENDWAIFLSSSFRHSPDLESIRLECFKLDDEEYCSISTEGYLLTEPGRAKLRQLLWRLESLDD